MISALCWSVLAAIAVAAPVGKTDRLAVLPIILEGEYGNATSSSIFSDVASATDMRVRLRVISFEEMFAASEEGLGDRVRECGSNIACIASRLRAFNARLGMVTVIDFSSKPPLLSLQLVDTDDAKLLASYVGELGGSLSEEIKKRAREVLEQAGYTRAGRLLVEVTPPNARISIAGEEPDPGTPNRFTVAPGSYRVNAALDGWSATHGEVAVASGEEARIALTLVEESSLLESPYLWIAVAASVIGAAVTVAVVTQDHDPCLCLVLGESPCGCAP